MPAPLADRIRPMSLDDTVGQTDLLSQGKALRSIIDSGQIPNLIFYGPSGVGKTTVAGIIAGQTKKALRRLNGTSASIADIKDIVSELDTLAAPNGILLYLDEIQYFNKKQQQSLLEYIEDGRITLIASTTENPYFYIYNAVLSRCTVFEFKSVEEKDIEKAVIRAFDFLSKENSETAVYDDNVLKYISFACSGDVRKAVNTCELAYLATACKNKKRKISLEAVQQITGKSSGRYDKNGDDHYDIISAYQKSMRGSDANAALHYLARLLDSGDLPSAVRRLLVCACEDVGLAYPSIIPIVKSACDIALQVGLPEAKIPLADAVILVCNSPKSNSGCMAIDSALADVESGKSGPIPRNLQNKHFDGEERNVKGQHYLYPHEFKNSWVEQQYLPDSLKSSVYYKYGDNKNEQAAKAYWDKVKYNK